MRLEGKNWKLSISRYDCHEAFAAGRCAVIKVNALRNITFYVILIKTLISFCSY